MSKFENYNNVSRCYDEQRLSMGSDVMAAMIQFRCGKPLKDIHVLDAGCGTGNYAVDFIEYGVGHMTLLDASPGMLGKAKSKLSDHIASGKVKDVIEGKLPSIPFPENTFDAVLFNVVLHHLESATEDRDFETTTAALREARRVLKPGGLIIISTVLPQNVKQSVWFSQIQTSLTDRFLKHFPYIEEWEQIFESAGLNCVQKLNLLGNGLMKDYMNFEGPLDDDWRKVSSYWSEGTAEEIEAVKAFITNLKDKGELENWAKAHDHVNTSGSLTVFALTKI